MAEATGGLFGVLSSAVADDALREGIVALFEAMDEQALISIADRRGRIQEVSAGFCRISGYDRSELLGQDHRLLNSGHHPRSTDRKR